ncbi:MAG: hypothetical protein IIA40_12410 [SAR324 cluster bacterium]|nr:hypothetical protein [SAR324 cluster bacterium]
MNDPYLRPMKATEIIGNAFRVYREHFALLVMVALVPHLVLLALDTVLLLPGPPAPGVMMILGLATLVTNGIALAAIAVAICRSIVGQELGFARTYAFTFRENVLGVVVAVLTPTLLISALAVPALLTGAMPVLLPLLVLVALAVGALLAPTIPIIIVEHKGAFEAMARSIVMMRRELLKGVAVFSFFIAITGLLPLVGVFAVLAGGVVALRVASPKTLFAVSGALAGLGGLGAFLLPGPALIYPAVIIMGIGSWLYVPKLLTLPMQMAGMTQERVAVVWGSLLTFSGFAMFVSPILVGGLRDLTGSFIPGLAVCAAASWALLLAGILLPRNITGAPIPATPARRD